MNHIFDCRSSTPVPPITLSLGSWQITEEDLPLYAGLASGVLLLIIVILSFTTWRICHYQSSSTKNRTKKGKLETFNPIRLKVSSLMSI